MNHTLRFWKLISEKKFAEAEKHLKKYRYFINKNYKNNFGNTFMHMAIWNMANYFYDEKNNDTENDSPMFLIKTMLDYGFDYKSKNTDNKFPIDMFPEKFNNEEYYTIRNNLKYILIKLFEKKGGIVFSGIRYVKDFNFVRSSKNLNKVCYINDNTNDQMSIHKELALNARKSCKVYNFYFDKYLLSHKFLGLFKNLANIIVANIGFIISDRPKTINNDHKRIFATFPIRDEEYLVVKGEHSEDALCDYLHNENNLKNLLQPLIGQYKNHKIYAVVLDVYSANSTCRECEFKLHKLQTDTTPNSFLYKLSNILNFNGYLLPKNRWPLQLVIRASSSYKYNPHYSHKKKLEKLEVQQWTGMHKIKKSEFFARDIKKFVPDVMFHINEVEMKNYQYGNFRDILDNLSVSDINEGTLRTLFATFGNSIRHIKTIKWPSNPNKNITQKKVASNPKKRHFDGKKKTPHNKRIKR